MTTIAEWLASVGLAQYARGFEQNDIDVSLLGDLTDQVLKDIGVASAGHRIKLLRAAAAAQAPVVGTPSRDPAPPPTEMSAVGQSAAERRHLTVMFCDLVGSTAMAARLDPEDMREVVRSYQAACAQVIARYDGFVAQYLGDGIMAYFGYPHAHEDDAERAVRTGLDLVTAVTKLDMKIKVEVRIGIATGLVVVGDLIGEHAAKERAVTGETPNLAARIQGLAAPGSIVIAASTRRLLGAQFDLRDLGPQSIKGVDAPVRAFAVEGVRSFESRFEARAGGLTGFVGREEECEHLLDRWTLARQGRGQVVLVSGEAGIGKSRLTAWLADKVAAGPHTRMRYQCTPHHKDSALYPTITQIERAAGIEPNEAAETKLAKLEAVLGLAQLDKAETVPFFALLLAIPTAEKYPPLAMSPGQQRQRTMTAMLNQIEGLSRAKPLLMIYEDAHWADASSLELLDALVDRVARLPVLLVVTGRPEFQPAWVGRHSVWTIPLQKLDRRDARAMVERVAGVALPAEVLDQIVQKTDGVPLFVEELTKTVLESGAFAEEGGSRKATEALPIPTTLQDSLMARLDRSNPVKEVAQIGATIGREFSWKLLLAVAGMDEGRVRTGLALLEETELASRRGIPPDATYTFKHALVQDAAYESLLKSRRKVIHRRVAKVLRDRFPILAEVEPEIIARHFSRGGRAEQAITWWARAGKRAKQRGNFVEAIAHYRSAIELADADRQTSPTLQLQLQVAYREALIAVRGWSAPDTRAAFERAAEFAVQINDPEERIVNVYSGWLATFVAGQLTRCLQLAQLIRDRASSADLHAHSVIYDTMLGQSLWGSGKFVEALPLLERAVEAYDLDKHQRIADRIGADIKLIAFRYLALTLWPLGYVDRAGKIVEQADAHAHRIATPASHAYAIAFACFYAANRADVVGMRRHAEDLITISEKHNLLMWLSTGYIFVNLACRNLSKVEKSNARILKEYILVEELQAKLNEPLSEGLRADLAGLLDPAQGISIIDNILSRTRDTGNQRLDADLHRKRASFLLRISAGNTAEAETALRQSLAVATSQKARTYQLCASLDLGRLYCDSGREREAIPLLQDALVGFAPTPELPEVSEAQQLLASLGVPSSTDATAQHSNYRQHN